MLIKFKKTETIGKIKFLENAEVPIDSIILWKNNPRKNQDAVDKLSQIIAVHGQVSPLVVWQKNMTIYKGNTTWKAMKKLGLKTCKVSFFDFPSEGSASAYAIDDNKASEYSLWDFQLMKKLMEAEKFEPVSFKIAEEGNFEKFTVKKESLANNLVCPKCGYLIEVNK